LEIKQDEQGCVISGSCQGVNEVLGPVGC